MPKPLLHHDRISHDHSIEHAVQVYCEDATPLLYGKITCVTDNSNASVVENVVKMPVVRNSLPDEMPNCFLAGNIDACRACLSATLHESGSHLFGIIFIDVSNHDHGTLLPQFLAEGLSYAGTPARNNRDFALELVHGILLHQSWLGVFYGVVNLEV